MPKTLSVYEVKSNFSRLLDGVAHDGDTITITRYGQPIASITPVLHTPARRELKGFPGLENSAEFVDCDDWFADDNWQDWEALNDSISIA